MLRRQVQGGPGISIRRPPIPPPPSSMCKSYGLFICSLSAGPIRASPRARGSDRSFRADKACPGQPAYILGGIQINGPTEGPELLAIRHFELRAPDGTLTDKMAALERALDLQVNGFN